MFYLRLALTAFRSLETNFMRSLLATLGVLIGVASVVACMSILEGASNRIVENFKSLGSNVLYVFPATAQIAGRTVGISQTLVMEDIDYLRRELSDKILAIAPEAGGAVTVKRLQKTEEATLIATSETYFEINAFKADRGRVFRRSEANDDLCTDVLIGHKLAEKLFQGMDPINELIQINSGTYRVIGVLEKKGNLGFTNADETVYMPIRAGLSRFFNRKWLNRLTILGADSTSLKDLEKQVRKVLRRSHGIVAGQPDDFNIFNQEQSLQNINQATMIFRVVFYSIAGISLVVGGIGIMNIMLVSVTERTREIGVRIAVGARRSDILLQFLVESMIISLLGGGFGVLLGMMFADLLEKVVVDLFKTQVTTTVIAASFITASLVGIFSGIYPAYKASRLDPVEALRYE